MSPKATIAALLLALAIAGPAGAHETGSLHIHAFGEVGGRVLDGEAFLVLRPGVALESERLLLVLAPLLQIRAEGEEAGRLRAEDLDAPNDLARLLYRLDLRGEDGSWLVRAGALSNETLGHGTVVSGFLAGLDPDSPATGVRVDMRGSSVDLEAIAGSLFEPGLMAARLSAAPVSLLGGEGRAAGAWRMGVLFAMDPAAPTAPAEAVGPARNLLARTGPLAFAALDTSLVLYRDHRLSIEPYADATITAAGPRRGRGAVHLGVLTTTGNCEELCLSLKAEARRLGSGYLAEHFDSFYSLERWGYPIGGLEPKAMVGNLLGGWGGRGELLVQGGSVCGELSFDTRPGGPMNAAARLSMSEWGPVSVAAFLGLRGSPASESFSQVLGLAELRLALTEAVYLLVRGARTFRVDPSMQQHVAIWDAGFSLGAAL